MADDCLRCCLGALRGAALLLTLGCASASALDLGPKTLPLKVAGITVQIPVTASIEPRTEAGVVTLRASATGDLRAIQEHALEIARHLRLPKGNCAHKGVNVVVDSIDAAKITPVRATAVVDLAGHVSVWACEKILGMRTKAKIASDRVSIAVPVEVYLPGPRTVALRLAGTATLAAGKLPRDATREFLGDLDELLSAELDRLLDTAAARATLPALPGLDATIESARFIQKGAVLTIEAKARGKVTASTLAILLQAFGK